MVLLFLAKSAILTIYLALLASLSNLWRSLRFCRCSYRRNCSSSCCSAISSRNCRCGVVVSWELYDSWFSFTNGRVSELCLLPSLVCSYYRSFSLWGCSSVASSHSGGVGIRSWVLCADSGNELSTSLLFPGSWLLLLKKLWI